MLSGMRYRPSSQTCQRFDDHWRYTADLAVGVSRALFINDTPKQTLSSVFWRILHHELTLAESLLRRLLVLIAMTMQMNVSDPRAPMPKQTSKARTPDATTAQKNPPLFSLFDRLDPLPRETRSVQKNSGPPPRFWVPGMDQMYPALPTPKLIEASRDTATLLRRFTALQDALENPGPHAARMAKWILQRQQSAIAAGYMPELDKPRDSPISYGRPPGVTKKRLGDMIHTVRRLSFDAHAALSTGFDTS